MIHFDKTGHLDIAYHSGPVRIGLGDPYMTAELVLDNGPTLDLLRPSPFPAVNAWVMIGNEPIEYVSATGLTLTARNAARPAWHNPGDQVFFARVIEVDMMGGVRGIR